jgi:hypothetical protein
VLQSQLYAAGERSVVEQRVIGPVDKHRGYRRTGMTYRKLLDKLLAFARDNPDHEALDAQVIVRLQTNEDNGEDLHVGGLQTASIDAGCTETFMLVLDADQEPDDNDGDDADGADVPANPSSAVV